MEMPVSVDLAWCKRCGICHAFCPAGVFELAGDGAPAVARPQACTLCRTCEILCPDFAIRVAGGGATRAGNSATGASSCDSPKRELAPEGGGCLG